MSDVAMTQARTADESEANPAYALAWTLAHFETKEGEPEASPADVREAFKANQRERLRTAHKVLAALERRGFRLVKA